ncbi:hypothetical protein CBS9595_004312 [Malassezia furfur]|nr:hypothetical protein CBS9595_004312 [Malassezia furfur]
MQEDARVALANKLRSKRTEEIPAQPAPQPAAPGPKDPFKGAKSPVVVTDPHWAPRTPHKRIVAPEDMDRFQASPAFAEILGMLRALNDGAQDRSLTDDVEESEPVQTIHEILARVAQIVKETPRSNTAASTSRFGNPEFRTFYTKLQHATDDLLQLFPSLRETEPGASQHRRTRDELAIYLQESWGNAGRIDYGSGMELNFLCWLLLLVKLGIVELPRDAPALVLRIFWQYIELMRVIEAEYWLEPAGSHGVWGLDDYHFLPFLFGSSQLYHHGFLRPGSIHDEELVDDNAPRYMYFSCIQSINAVKTESLRWHSPMLDDISSVKTWSKVNEGMAKMYRSEVLLKLPIAQHIFFGTLLDFGVPEDEANDTHINGHGATASAHPEAGVAGANGHAHGPACGHGHAHGEGQAAGWGDCCGIPIPSAFAAAEQAKRGPAKPLRRIPFD